MIDQIPTSKWLRCSMGLKIGLLVLAGSLWAQEKTCRDCHDQIEIAASIHADLTCTDCHRNIKDWPHSSEDLNTQTEDQICAQCHGASAALARSVHAAFGCRPCHGAGHDMAPPRVDACAKCHNDAASELAMSSHAEDCKACHGAAHTLLKAEDLNALTSPIQQIQSCGRCHNRPPELLDGFLGSVHAKALLVSGLLIAPSCSDCHSYHGILPASNGRSTVAARNVPQTCGACHGLTFRTWVEQGAHGRLWKHDGNGPVCTSCHRSHEILEPVTTGVRRRSPEDCGGCHGEAYASFRDSFHGKATDLGFTTAAICSDCHTSHQNLPADDVNSSIHPENRARTCGECHHAVSASFASFDPHSDPSDPNRTPQVYYVWLGMTGLLLGVFVFFGIHDTLWLQRSLVGVMRGEFNTGRHKDNRYIQRFSKVHIWTHGMIVLTFLALAASGLPLKYHFAGWAQGLINAFGGLEGARFVHRLAAMLTFGYGLFHLAYLFNRVVVKKQHGYFWGFNSMMPQPRDFTHLGQNLRYFLYLGRRPKADRWTYWEKFDYLAVFWGIPVIGLSGLILWFPGFFTQFLPGWTLNAAFVVHSDEALLATGYIFVFHFFHAHLKPESFPLDPVIFTGRIPLARFKEQRSLEYQRLVDSGELEAHLVGPPSRSQALRAYGFGFTATTIGLLLAVGIFWGILGG